MHKSTAIKRAQAAAPLQRLLGAAAGATAAPAAASVAAPLPPFATGAVPLALQAPDEPADVMYENLGVSRVEVALRRGAVALLRYVVLLGAFAAASVADTIANEVEIRGQCIECGVYDEAGALLALDDEQRTRFEACHNSGPMPHCLCRKDQGHESRAAPHSVVPHALSVLPCAERRTGKHSPRQCLADNM